MKLIKRIETVTNSVVENKENGIKYTIPVFKNLSVLVYISKHKQINISVKAAKFEKVLMIIKLN